MFEQVKKMIAEQLNIDANTISEETRILEDLAADSLDLIEMITVMEDTYNISITDEEIGTLKTAGDISSFLTKKTGKK